jgi:hypothetical protein
MKRLALGLVLLHAVNWQSGAASSQPVPIPPAAEILQHLRPEHPRLLATSADFAALTERASVDPTLRAWHTKLRERARRILDAPPSKYEIPDGLRLLATSRRVVQRVQTLGLLYRLEGDRRYAERAWQELDAAAHFQDWNPRHFLDTAEMTHAFALGYDWLYDAWSDAQRAALRRAMVEMGLRPALKIESENRWWAVSRHNWNQVCNGGIGMGALALGDVEPELCGEFLHAALKSIQLAMAEYGPDGAWGEGPGYWHYATTYNVVFLAALEVALGTDFGLSKIEGFSEAGSFPIYASGPAGLSFSYADAHAGVIRAPVMFWLARRFNRPDYGAHQRRVAEGDPLDLLWYDARLAQPPAAPPPLDRYYRNSEAATMRSAWDDPNALFIGFKAGDNKVNHSHLDVGGFVLDALGTRWAVDLGADDYNLPAYFGNRRWTYYRLRAESHNTLVLNPGAGPDQDPRAATRISRFASQPGRAFAIADLTPAYAAHAQTVTRGMALLARRHVLVQDEVNAEQPADAWWFLHTEAQVELGRDEGTATLTRGKGRLWARILAPREAKFAVLPAKPLPTSPQPEKQAENEGVRKLAIHCAGVKELRLAVLLVPLREGEEPPATLPEVKPLAAW